MGGRHIFSEPIEKHGRPWWWSMQEWKYSYMKWAPPGLRQAPLPLRATPALGDLACLRLHVGFFSSQGPIIPLSSSLPETTQLTYYNIFSLKHTHTHNHPLSYPHAPLTTISPALYLSSACPFCCGQRPCLLRELTHQRLHTHTHTHTDETCLVSAASLHSHT